MTGSEASRFWRSAAQYVVGGKGLALLTFARSRLGLDLTTMGFAYLILIAPLSMTGSIVGSAILSIVAVACLNYFCVRIARMCGRRRPS
jgi:hypothetical protein